MNRSGKVRNAPIPNTVSSFLVLSPIAREIPDHARPKKATMNMILQGNLQQMKGKDLDERVDHLLEVVGLKDASDKRASRYSGGMKKRLDLATILVHKPKVLFLDEPTTGLDPHSRAAVWDYLDQLNKKEGITIFLTTQK